MYKYIEFAKPYNLKSMIEYSDGATVSKILTKNKSGNTTLFAFDKGQNLSEHTAPFDAIVLIIEGSCNIMIDGKNNQMNEGQIILMPAEIPHAIEGTDAFKILLIMIKEETK